MVRLKLNDMSCNQASLHPNVVLWCKLLKEKENVVGVDTNTQFMYLIRDQDNNQNVMGRMCPSKDRCRNMQQINIMCTKI